MEPSCNLLPRVQTKAPTATTAPTAGPVTGPGPTVCLGEAERCLGLAMLARGLWLQTGKLSLTEVFLFGFVFFS